MNKSKLDKGGKFPQGSYETLDANKLCSQHTTNTAYAYINLNRKHKHTGCARATCAPPP